MEGQYVIIGNYRYGQPAVHFFLVSANRAWDGKRLSSSALPTQAIPPNNCAYLLGLNT